ncbi:2-amino-4-hydroxy-6-hydroxymethyldihydropteridine diphosphokinase [Sphingoaurantiacus capsulatus]|uniref:2-amino-4-hydroxy-6-hydroxymethyldihydropteridine pyrophosphokinase n=1 Tax=Sphingoaurantiacus capsulatus TaxID=1771310 RepID=A0ABV7XCD8_9SPHN
MDANVIIALGSNRRHGRYGPPALVVTAAIEALGAHGIRVDCRSRIHATAPVGPSDRTFANAVIAAQTSLSPHDLLAALKEIERDFGRRRGRRWGARVLDLDIIAYGDTVLPSRAVWPGRHGLAIPHRAMHLRDFVLLPMREVAPDWRHPLFNRTVRQLVARGWRA